MTVRTYFSTDPGAPVLSGTAGALIGVLDACLVTGYGSKTPAGWTKPFSGTNLAAYRQGAGSNGFYLRVDDTPAQFSRVVGYEAMTAVDTGTAPFPTDTQVSGGLYLAKSSASDTTARAWTVIATEKAFWVYFNVMAAAGTHGQLLFFGDIVSYKPSDAYHTLLIANTAATTSTNSGGFVSHTVSTLGGGHYLARAQTQLVGAIQAGKITDSAKANLSNSAPIGTQGMAYPNASDGGLYLAPCEINESNGVRGRLPGLWAPLHGRPLAHLDTFAGSGELTGRLFSCSISTITARSFLRPLTPGNRRWPTWAP